MIGRSTPAAEWVPNRAVPLLGYMSISFGPSKAAWGIGRPGRGSTSTGQIEPKQILNGSAAEPNCEAPSAGPRWGDWAAGP